MTSCAMLYLHSWHIQHPANNHQGHAHPAHHKHCIKVGVCQFTDAFNVVEVGSCGMILVSVNPSQSLTIKDREAFTHALAQKCYASSVSKMLGSVHIFNMCVI